MKIQIFGARSVPARWGGFDNTATELSTRFAKWGHDVTVYIMKKYALEKFPKEYAGVKLRYVPTIYGKYSETIIHEMLSAIIGLFQKDDISYVLGCRTSFIYLLYKLIGKKIIFNTDGLDFQRDKWGRLAKLYLRLNYWIAAKIGDHLIHDNTHIQEYFKKIYNRKGVFISIGGYEYISRSEQIVREKYKVIPGEYYLIACRIEPENNIHLLIEGFVKSKSKKKLIVAGGANYKSEYIVSLKKIANDRVVFLGPVYEGNDIEELHYHSYAYLHGHRVGGTNPSLLKAMGCRNLIISNGTRYNKEVLGDNGLYFSESSDSICDLIHDAELEGNRYMNMKQGAVQRLRKFYIWDYSSKLHIKYFEYALGKSESYKETF